MMQKHGRFLLVALLLIFTTLFLYGWRRSEVVPLSMPLSQFPVVISDWNGKEVEIGDDARRVLGAGDFMLRRYEQAQNPRDADVDLFVAYFPSQRAGQTMHSPKNCMPGEGWLPVESSYESLDMPGRAAISLNRYVLGKGDARMLVFYWYQAHSRTIANEYKARLFLVLDAARMNRTDGALVRINTLVMPDEDLARAEARLRGFARRVVPQLEGYIPR